MVGLLIVAALKIYCCISIETTVKIGQNLAQLGQESSLPKAPCALWHTFVESRMPDIWRISQRHCMMIIGLTDFLTEICKYHLSWCLFLLLWLNTFVILPCSQYKYSFISGTECVDISEWIFSVTVKCLCVAWQHTLLSFRAWFLHSNISQDSIALC